MGGNRQRVCVPVFDQFRTLNHSYLEKVPVEGGVLGDLQQTAIGAGLRLLALVVVRCRLVVQHRLLQIDQVALVDLRN